MLTKRERKWTSARLNRGINITVTAVRSPCSTPGATLSGALVQFGLGPWAEA
jgi:hypothetical protein